MRHITDARKMTVIWLVRLLLIAAVLLATAIELIHASPFVGVIVGVVSLSAAALFGCWYVPAYFRRYDVVLQNGAVHVTHGVISISHTVIPLRHVLTVSISATPLMRVFGVRMVTLGMPSHRILLHCVRREAVEALTAYCGETDA